MNKILFVCMGNICRSPIAEGVARAAAERTGLVIEFDSAGTLGYHAGEAPDPRARAVARRCGAPIDDLRARQVVVADFDRFDLILAADRNNLIELRRLQPAGSRAELALLLDWTGTQAAGEVPDPYYGDASNFESVYRQLEAAADGLVKRLAGIAGTRASTGIISRSTATQRTISQPC